jgi:two-component system chemotaxis response regulator CheB
VRELRALVVDDSSLNRRTIAAILREIPGVSQVDVANDGADALRVVEGNPPDFITLDLEMPRLDGFEFLQLLMDRHPLPVVVVSGLSAKENVFRALELGAIDFLEKPQGEDAPLEHLRNQLAEKVRVVQQLSPLALRRTTLGGLALDAEVREPRSNEREPSVLKRVPSKVIVIGASTGGPKALVTLFRHLHDDVDAALVIAQHMPPRFTGTFAARLDRTGVVQVSEAKQYERLARGHAYVCPGGRCIEVVPSDRGPAIRVIERSPSCSQGWGMTVRLGCATSPLVADRCWSKPRRLRLFQECLWRLSGPGYGINHSGYGPSATCLLSSPGQAANETRTLSTPRRIVGLS